MSPRDFPRPRAAPDAVPLEGQPHPAGRDLRRELSSEGLALHFRRENLIDRSALVSQLKRSEHPLILLQGAAGYGKTALLHQWCEQDGRSFASLSLDAGDNDPLVLLAYALVALDTPSPVRDQLLAGPLADPAFLKAVTLPRLIERWASRTTPLVLVLDDVHVLRDPRCWTLIGALVEGLPQSSHIVLSGRREPPLPLARWQANQQLLRVGQSDLSMSAEEAARLLATYGVRLNPIDAGRLQQRTRGWPAALALAALELQRADDRSVAIGGFSGATPSVSGYLNQEVLADLPNGLLRFLERTSILPVLVGEMCDAVLQLHGSGDRLAELLESGVIQPSEGAGHFHCHPLLRDLLANNLRRHEPENEPVLHRRAAEWLQAAGRIGEAMEQARRSDDPSLAADLLWQRVPQLLGAGRRRVLEGWLRTFSDRELLAQPQLSLATAWCALEAGRQVEPWAAAADRAMSLADAPQGASSLQAARLLLKASLGADGLAATAATAQAAYSITAPDDPWRSLSCYLAGTALQLQGKAAAGAQRIEEGEQLSRLLSVPTVHALCLAQRSLLAFEENEWEMMQASAGRALELVRQHQLSDLATMVPVFAAVALSQAHDQRREESQRTARHAARLLSYIAPRIPWLSLEVRILLARTYLMLGDASAARTVLAEAQSMLDRIVDAPLLIRRLEEAWSLVTSAPLSTQIGPSSLTTAELRVLHLLPTHLSFQEIGNALFLSRNTVKTQAISAYRKLGVSSRGEAVEQARSLGLLSGFPSTPPY